MAGLLACPFCRELFSTEDNKVRCPECDVKLEPLSRLPPSLDAQWDGEHVDPLPILAQDPCLWWWFDGC